MNRWLATAFAGALAFVGGALGATGTSGAVTVRTQGLPVHGHAEVGYPPFSNVGSSDEAAIWLDGAVLFSTQGKASWDWQPQTTGEHVLEFWQNGMAVTSKMVNVASLAFEEDKLPDPPTEPDLNISITPERRDFGTGSGAGAIVTSGSGTWTGSASEPWISLTASSGSAGYPVVYTVEATTNAEERTGYVYVSGHVHTVVQAGLGGSIAPTRAEFEGAGGEGTIAVTASVGWKARANCDWIRMETTGGTGPGRVAFTVAPLNEVLTRKGTLTVAGNTFAVVQYGRRMKLASSSATLDYLAHEISVAVEALSITEWQVKSNAGWIAVSGATSGQGSGTVTFSIAENPSWKARTGTVTIGTETFTVTQSGRTALVFDISPAASTASVGGGECNHHGDGDTRLAVDRGQPSKLAAPRRRNRPRSGERAGGVFRGTESDALHADGDREGDAGRHEGGRGEDAHGDASGGDGGVVAGKL